MGYHEPDKMVCQHWKHLFWCYKAENLWSIWQMKQNTTGVNPNLETNPLLGVGMCSYPC